MSNFIIWCLLGGFAGWHFGLRTRRDAVREVQRNIAVGTVGGLLGGFLFRWSALPDPSGAESLLMALGGAIVLLALGNWFL